MIRYLHGLIGSIILVGLLSIGLAFTFAVTEDPNHGIIRGWQECHDPTFAACTPSPPVQPTAP